MTVDIKDVYVDKGPKKGSSKWEILFTGAEPKLPGTASQIKPDK